MANKKKNNKKQASPSSSKFIFWIIGIIAAFILGFIFLGNHSKPDNQAKSADSIDYSKQPFLGEETAPVSIIEFGDYKCPNCKHFTENVVPLIQKEFVDTGKAKFYFMNDAFINDDSIRSAKFAESVFHELGNKIFWDFHDLLYKKQPEDPKYEKIDIYDEKYLTGLLKEVAGDEDVTKVVENFRDGKSNAAFNKDMDYAKELNVTGTPTLFVNGKMFTGQTMDDLKKMVDDAAKKKEK